MSVHRARVTVRLKSAILDPQGRAVAATVARLGFSGVEGLRVGKIIEFDVHGTREEALERVTRMAHEVLANPVMEDVEIELESEDGSRGESGTGADDDSGANG